MKWNVYINHKQSGGDYKTSKHVVHVKGSRRGDNSAVTFYAAKHFNVHEDRVLCIPQPASEKRKKAEAHLAFESHSARRDPSNSARAMQATHYGQAKKHIIAIEHRPGANKRGPAPVWTYEQLLAEAKKQGRVLDPSRPRRRVLHTVHGGDGPGHYTRSHPTFAKAKAEADYLHNRGYSSFVQTYAPEWPERHGKVTYTPTFHHGKRDPSRVAYPIARGDDYPYRIVFSTAHGQIHGWIWAKSVRQAKTRLEDELGGAAFKLESIQVDPSGYAPAPNDRAHSRGSKYFIRDLRGKGDPKRRASASARRSKR